MKKRGRLNKALAAHYAFGLTGAIIHNQLCDGWNVKSHGPLQKKWCKGKWRGKKR